MKSEKALQLVAEEQMFEKTADKMSELISRYAPDEDELDLASLEYVAAAANALPYDRFLQIAKSHSNGLEKR